ncbi:MAG: beta-ketoacyl-ACP synthase III [Acidimicrobiales bacterium]
MMPSVGLRFSGVGAYLPPTIVTNDDLSATMDTSDEWIRERTGITERRIGGTTTELAVEAARAAMADAGATPDSIDHVILATTTPDQMCPATSTAVARELGLSCGAVDVQAVCSGWVYGLVIANGFLLQGMKKILLIGAESLDRVTDYTDRGTGILFGNGAAAVILEPEPSMAGQILGYDLGADGNFDHILYIDHGSTWSMDGKEVFRQAVKAIVTSTNNTLAMAGLTTADVDFVIPHQANVRIVEAAWKRLGFTMEQTSLVLDRTGNTSSASIPLALDDALNRGRINDGDKVLFVGFGAGMTWGSTLVTWAGKHDNN